MCKFNLKASGIPFMEIKSRQKNFQNLQEWTEAHAELKDLKDLPRLCQALNENFQILKTAGFEDNLVCIKIAIGISSPL